MSTKALHAPPHEFTRVYVWELPVRVYHWLNGLCILILTVTGFIIANPPAINSASEAYLSYWFGTTRFIHFATAYVFLFNFAFRIYWGFVGNQYADWRNFLPLRWAQAREVLAVLRVDILQSLNRPLVAVGHNALAYLTYFAMFLVFLFQVASGFAMYASMSQSWFPHLFTWMLPLFGGDAGLRQWHHMATWFFIIFTIVHVYLVFYHDYVEGHGVLSSMAGGWKFLPGDPASKEGRSWFRVQGPGAGGRKAPPPVMMPTLPGAGLAAPTWGCADARVLIIGVGNLLMGDEGVGIHVLRALEGEKPVPGTELLDGGTGGINLLGSIERAPVVIMVDATRDGLSAGTVRRVRPARVADLPRGLSAHDFGLKDLFAASALLGRFPQIHLFTISVETVSPMCVELSPRVAAAVPEVAESILALAYRLSIQGA